MKDGYYYFMPVTAGKMNIDKSLGYISVSKCPKRSSYSMQCSLGQEIPAKFNCRGIIEVFLSSDTYVNAESIRLGRLDPASKGKLFIDSLIPSIAADSVGPEQYVIVTTSGRTLCYATLFEKQEQPAAPAEPAPEQPPQMQSESFTSPVAPVKNTAEQQPLCGKPFDPFDTTNSAYKWYIYDNCTEGPNSVRNVQELDKMLRYFNVHYDMFAKLSSGGNSAPYNDTFLKMSYYAVQIAGHVLRGEYKDPENGRHFTVIGLPGWNAMTNNAPARNNRRRSNAQQQMASGNTKGIRECSRWLAAKRKPPCSYNRNYNGYWLYYFDAESGLPVKAVMKND